MTAAVQELLALGILGGAAAWLAVRWLRDRRVRDCPGCASTSPAGRAASRSLSVLPPRS